MQKGLTRETISALLTPTDSFSLISHHIQHKLSFHPDTLTDKKKKEKLIRWLLGKGFGYSDIVKAIGQLQSV
jgi:SOS response regulatory protein OraA/RecX